MRFWDTSALVLLLRREPMSRTLRTLFNQDPNVVIWWGARIECASYLARLVREGRLGQSGEAEARGALDDLYRRADEVAPSTALRDRAERLVADHPLRAADALQSAAALTWARERPDRAGFVCLDQHLRAAAGREGFDILPADRHLR